MPHIPQEILDIIVRCAAAADIYGSCAFVSHTFHQIFLPYNFKSLTFWNEIREHIRCTEDIPIPKFCVAINAGDAHALSLAPLVQELRLLGWSGRDGFGNEFLKEPFEKIINSVLSFRNLTKLSMEKCVISPLIMEQLGKLVQLQSLYTLRCQDEPHQRGEVSYGALSNLQSLHTLECRGDYDYVERHLACIPMKNLRILKSSDMKVTEVLLTSDPPVQLKELWVSYFINNSLLWNYLARVTSLTHLSLPFRLPELESPPPSHIFTFPELQHLHVHVSLAPLFADQPMNEMKIDSNNGGFLTHLPMGREELSQHWEGIVFPHVEYLDTDIWREELEAIPIEFWREFLPNVKEVR